MPSPVRGQSGDRPLTQIPAALADMFAAALRGGVKATMGMPGDLEGLGRAGLNKMGAGVDPTPALPTSDFMNEWLPSDGGRMPTAEKLGEFLPLPATLGVGQAAKQVGPMVKALRGAEAPVDMGRRGALQTMGKAGAGAAAATVAPHMMAEALRAAPEAGAVAKAVAPTVAKAAAHVWKPAEVIANSGALRAMYEGGDTAVLAAHQIHPDTMAVVQKHFKDPEELGRVNEWLKHWDEPFEKKYKSDFDYKTAHEKWYDDMRAAGAEDMAISNRTQSTKGYAGDPYVMDPEFKELGEQLKKKYFPDSAVRPEWHKMQDNYSFMADMPKEKLMGILKNSPAGQVPPELAARGITAKDLAYHAAPIRGRGTNNYSAAEDLMDQFGYDLGHMDRPKPKN